MNKVLHMMPAHGMRAVYGNDKEIQCVTPLVAIVAVEVKMAGLGESIIEIAGIGLDGLESTHETGNFLGFLPPGFPIPEPGTSVELWGATTPTQADNNSPEVGA